MRDYRRAIRVILLIGLLACSAYTLVGQERAERIDIKFEPELITENDGVRGLATSCKLYTIVAGQQYFIADLVRGAVNIPVPLVDPTNTYVFYASNVGCGADGEGMAIWVSDVRGESRMPILGRCRYLRPVKFLTYQSRNYLLINGSSRSPFRDIWLYDISAASFVMHAEGELDEIRDGLFSYRIYDTSARRLKVIGNVSTGTLVQRGAPLSLLTRFPTHCLTEERDVKLYKPLSDSGQCEVSEQDYQVIHAANTKVLFLSECRDGGFEVLYNGIRGKVVKGGIKPVGPK
ncbi:MAG TPA: hypothetical protein VFV34_24645 [Blastocatellia bacterium]|nr:hypothetical protein [Blastocatellia bacterium]